MATLSTGPIDNSPVSGIRPTQFVTVKLVNRDPVNSATVAILGYVLSTTRTLYVNEENNIAPNGVLTRNYYADLDAFEFIFTTGALGEEEVEISVWGKQATGQLVDTHRVVAQESDQ